MNQCEDNTDTIIKKLEEQEAENQRLKSYLDPSEEVFATLQKDSEEVREILSKYKALRKRTKNLFLDDFKSRTAILTKEDKDVHARIDEIDREIAILKTKKDFDAIIKRLQDDIDQKKRVVSTYRIEISTLQDEVDRLSQNLPPLPDLDSLYAKRKRAEEKLEVRFSH